MKKKYTLFSFKRDNGTAVCITEMVDDTDPMQPIVKVIQNAENGWYQIGKKIWIRENNEFKILKQSDNLEELEEIAMLEIL